MIKICLIIGLFAIGIGPAAAQQRADSVAAPSDSLPAEFASPDTADVTSGGAILGASGADDRIHVRVTTNARSALLFADSTLLGRVPADFIAIPAETRQLRLTLADANTWSVPPVDTELKAEPGDSVVVKLHFPYRYRIESVPFGADVHLERGSDWIFLGSTPLLHTSNSPLQDPIVVERSGFAVERLSPGTDVWNRHVIMLRPSGELDPTAAQVDWRPPRQRRVWIDYAALGTALVAGVVAVHYKFKADNLYATYQETADPALRDDIHAYDVRSGVAFGVMQGGLGLFALRLILR